MSIINRNAGSIIAWASSESSSAISAVERLKSANSAVTVLRSPLGCSGRRGIGGDYDFRFNRRNGRGGSGFSGADCRPTFLAESRPQLQLRSAFLAERGVGGAVVVAGRAAHRVSCDPDYNHTLRGRQKERGALRASRERSINVLGSSSITLSCQVGSLARVGFVTQLQTIDTDRLVADPNAIDELNQSVIKEFRANQGKVGGPMEGMPILLLTMTGAKTGRTLVRPLCYSRDADRIVIIASYGGAPQVGTSISEHTCCELISKQII